MTDLIELCRPWGPGEAPPLDRLDNVIDWPSELQRTWTTQGYVILRGFVPEHLIDAYERAWLVDNQDRPSGWPCDTPYMHEPALLDLAGCIAEPLAELIGEPCGLHLNLSGWRSTTRNWHQDGYLNPDSNADHYVAAWFALEDISPDAGPFEYVPGSHREFGVIRQDLMLDALETDVTNTSWPRDSERILTPLFEREIRDRHLPVEQFLACRGDVLLWHPRLLHRGSMPADPTLERRALIAHFSGIQHRPDMPHVMQAGLGGGWYFRLHQDHGACW